MFEMSQTKSNPNGFPHYSPNPNGVPYYSPGLPEQREGYPGFAYARNTTLKGLPNTLFKDRLCNPFRVVFINEQKSRVGSFVANPGLYYETPLGFSNISRNDIGNMTEHWCVLSFSVSRGSAQSKIENPKSKIPNPFPLETVTIYANPPPLLTVDSKKQSQPPDAPTFEQALEQLENIVESMESGDTPLADLLVKFEEGARLLKICEARLKEAEIKIELLKKQKNGDPAFAEFPVADRE